MIVAVLLCSGLHVWLLWHTTVTHQNRCAVQRIEVDTGRIVATFKRTVVPPCPSALFITTLLEEGVTAANATAAISSSDDSESSVSAAARALPDFTKYPIGCTRDATVIKVYTKPFKHIHCLHVACLHCTCALISCHVWSAICS
jgi:hypothetical protein